ncbi:unnamed protein product [Parnassius mnemosyne]|uniref:FGFR1 oncogene partner (FOP) N-terminal dimerisation domain-containing protein n=1 Tax=Parnassius mnemosyne TaxID=213953 RepID=A0AAV1LXB2_9NEOP
MAQAEDTELRDLVVEALEKNGSLAKIRALLRANIFLVFEDDCENIKQNVNLENILKIPEGILCLSLVHEFLELCNLKNTLFVYMSESRQGKEYSYEGHSSLSEKLKLTKRNKDKEPLLVTLVKNVLQQQKKLFGHNENSVNRSDNIYKDEQNNTYIVHEDSTSGTSHTNSDNSSDEKNKLHLRLPLDNSDTDTSSDSARDKTSSEYTPSEHSLTNQVSPNKNTINLQEHSKNQIIQNSGICVQEPEKNKNASSVSDTTSYVKIKPLSPLEKVLINTTGVPYSDEKNVPEHTKVYSKIEVESPTPKHPSSSLKSNNNNHKYKNEINKIEKQRSEDSGNDITGYSLDFTSTTSGNKDSAGREVESESVEEKYIESSLHKLLSHHENSDQKSITTPSSVSTSEAADIISDKSNSLEQKYIEKNSSQNSKSIMNQTKNSLSDHNKLLDDDSGDYSESPIPSLSNLSLEIHSD